MKKFTWGLIVTTIILSMFLIGPSNALAKATEWRFNYSMPKMIPPSNGWEWFAQELTKQSEGKLKLTVFPHATLFHIKEAVENIMAGTAEFSNFSIRTHAKRFPLISVSMLPSVTFPDTVEGTFAASQALMTLYNEFPEIQKEFEGVKLVWINMLAPYYLFSKKPIKLPTDLKGLKVGTGGIQRKMVSAGGGSTVAIIPPKAYMSMKTGVVDAMIMGWGAVAAYKAWEVAGYYMDYSLGRVPLPVIMNLDTWNKTSPEIKKLIEKLAVEQTKIGCEGLHESEKRGLRLATEGGMKAVKTSGADQAKWKSIIQPLEAEWLAQMKAAGETAAPRVLKRYKALSAEAWK